jgi:chloramphenicol 3-O phosphotransferase
MDKEYIIFLNGTSSSGKTVIAKALQEILDGYYIHTGIDHYLERVPDKLHVRSDGKNPGAADGFLWVFPNDNKRVSEIRLGPAALRLLTGMYRAIAALSRAGNNLIVDDVIFDSRVLQEAVNTLYTLNVLFVGVRCTVDTSNLTPLPCANQIKNRLQSGPAPNALRRLQNILRSK